MGRKVKTAEERQQEVIDDYKDAYKRVYGIYPKVTVDGVYIRISGQSAGVNLRRLKTMTTQLGNAHHSITSSHSLSNTKQRPAKMFRG